MKHQTNAGKHENASGRAIPFNGKRNRAEVIATLAQARARSPTGLLKGSFCMVIPRRSSATVSVTKNVADVKK